MYSWFWKALERIEIQNIGVISYKVRILHWWKWSLKEIVEKVLESNGGKEARKIWQKKKLESTGRKKARKYWQKKSQGVLVEKSQKVLVEKKLKSIGRKKLESIGRKKARKYWQNKNQKVLVEQKARKY